MSRNTDMQILGLTNAVSHLCHAVEALRFRAMKNYDDEMTLADASLRAIIDGMKPKPKPRKRRSP